MIEEVTWISKMLQAALWFSNLRLQDNSKNFWQLLEQTKKEQLLQTKNCAGPW